MKTTHLSHGIYRISDSDAGRLVKAAGFKLPRRGYEIDVPLPEDLQEQFRTEKKAVLHRTPFGKGNVDAPKRGWVWAILVQR